MSSFSHWSYLVAGSSSFVASSFELSNLYRRSPFCNRKFAAYWLSIASLDAAAGCGAIALCYLFKLAAFYTWLGTWYGWLVVGLSGALIMRANFAPINVGKATVPIGTGILYSSIRSLFEKPLKEKNWQINYAIKQGRIKWSLDTVDVFPGRISMESTSNAARDYLRNNLSAEKSPKELAELEAEIISAKLNGAEVEQVKQLITYMVEKNYTAALDALLGSPDRKVIRGWRIQSALDRVPIGSEF